MKSALLALVLLVVAGCDSSSDSQLLPIGSRCSSASQCGTSPFDCAVAGYPFGYCQKPCTTDGDCPMDSLCAPGPKECRRRCKMSQDCRVDEGYNCFVLIGGNGVCEPSLPVDAGGT